MCVREKCCAFEDSSGEAVPTTGVFQANLTVCIDGSSKSRCSNAPLQSPRIDCSFPDPLWIHCARLHWASLNRTNWTAQNQLHRTNWSCSSSQAQSLEKNSYHSNGVFDVAAVISARSCFQVHFVCAFWHLQKKFPERLPPIPAGIELFHSCESCDFSSRSFQLLRRCVHCRGTVLCKRRRRRELMN